MRTDAAPLGWGWTIRLVIGLIGLALAISSVVPGLHAQSGTVGEWRTLGRLMPINPVHAALMNNGKVLIVSGSGNVAAETNFRSAVLDVFADTLTVTSAQPWDMFCNGMVVLSDGRVFVNGGNLKYDPFWGQPKNAVFNPATGLFTDVQNMAHGRWYPTVTTLGDGRVMTFSGLLETGGTNTAVEFYTPGTGWSQEYPAGWTPPLYPRMHLLPDGRVIYSGSGAGTRFFNPATRTWTGVVATTKYGNTRNYGTSVLLPLRPSDGYKGRVMIFGGANPATATTEIIDTSAATPQWQFGPSMSQPRIELNATLLPNGKVLVTGGSAQDESAATASYNADLYDPVTNTFSSAGANVYPRLYHSNALLLPDATVLLLGGNPTRGSYETHMEVYSPAYLFKTDAQGNPIPRPVITTSPGSISYGASFQVPTDDPADIASVVLVRPGTPTHAFDMEQRLVELSFNSNGGVLNATAPPNGNIAPPGYYMLFILNSAGVPSIASFVRLSTAANQAPTATIDNPATNVTVNPGGLVSFSGTGSDSDGTISSYAWTFPGGSPSSSPLASPGDVTYSAPGTYQASLSVTDNGGLTSAAATRTITVSDFSLTATPSSTSTVQNATAGYTATVGALAGFTGSVSLSVSGLPNGANATFSPQTINTSGSSALTVSTNSSTPIGTYTLTIRGTSGTFTRTTNVSLIVANQPPTAAIDSPAANMTVNPGGTVAFSGTGTDPDGTISTYAWTFPGGSPASSTLASPGDVTYSVPGTYQASLRVTDNGGLTSVAATRTITVSDFSVTATPASSSVVQGASAAYTVTVGALAGFTGSVALSVTGLPAGATATFNPQTITASGSSALTISTLGTTPAGTYTLTIRGTSGSLARTVNATLIVAPVGDFTISVTPASQTVQNGSNATYTITITPVGGFTSAVTLSVGSLPKFVNPTFSPSTITQSGNSVLTLTTKKQTKNGTSTVTITGASGTLAHSVNVALIVQ
ncbi:MAG TPA: galactose oxidase-like domain-containing protein [Vicinamibacterales bacterium]|nr:galactose oxidase-like domain-containing protein [Vicinamibacterales bacterium]